MNTELEKLKESLASLDIKFKQIKAEMPEDDKHMQMMDLLWNSLGSLRQYVYSVDDRLYSHANDGHIPKLTPSQLEELLDSCGAGGDYNVNKRQLFASAKYDIKANKDGTVVELKLPKKD